MGPDERFWQRVNRGDGCWEWQGTPGPRGFGQVKVEGRPQLAHRAAWFFIHGDWPVGEVTQSCGNRLCVRPEHLVSGSAPVVVTKPARRARGSGSVQQCGQKVRIRASVKDPVTGRRLQPSFTVDASNVKAELDRVRSEMAEGRHRGTAVTFGDLLDKTIVTYVPTLAPSAQQVFKDYAKYLRPLRDHPLRRLEEHPEIIEEFYAAGIPALRGNGKVLNPMSVRHVHWVLAQAFHSARRGGGSTVIRPRTSSCRRSSGGNRTPRAPRRSGPYWPPRASSSRPSRCSSAWLLSPAAAGASSTPSVSPTSTRLGTRSSSAATTSGPGAGGSRNRRPRPAGAATSTWTTAPWR